MAVNFWYIVMIAVLVWYSTITIYVAIRGSFDVKQMLANLKKDHADEGLPPRPGK
jgi:hypothetical protein